MEDLGARLEQLLSDPQTLSQIGELAASLGLGQPPENGAAASPAAPAGEPSSPDLSALLGMLGAAPGPSPALAVWILPCWAASRRSSHPFPSPTAIPSC